MQLEQELRNVLQKAFQCIYHLELDPETFNVQMTNKAFLGHFSLPMFPYVKLCHDPCQVVGERIGSWLLQNKVQMISGYQMVNGFLNLVIHDAVWLDLFRGIHQQSHYGQLPSKKRSIVIEFSCPNTNKPQHLGHLRNNFLGSALAEILQAAGYTVHKVNLINDRGIHICKSMIAYAQFGQNETPESSGLKGDHLVGKYYVKYEQVYRKQLSALTQQNGDLTPAILLQAQQMLLAWENNDPETMALWKKLNRWVYDGFAQTYSQLGISFAKTYYESDTYLLGKKVVEEGLHKKHFFLRDDGAVVVDLDEDQMGQKVLLRSDQTAVYITQDLGTADLRYADYAFDKMIYVVGNEQTYHFKVLFSILGRLNRAYAPNMYHLPYGMVNLPSGKMKSREGKVVDADTLIDEMTDSVNTYIQTNEDKLAGMTEQERHKLSQILAIGALKFFLLRVAPEKKMLFNPNESIDLQGDTATFIQYTYARICSLQNKAQLSSLDSISKYAHPLNQIEQMLILELYLFPGHIQEAAEHYMPSIIANYALTLAKWYNKFYTAYPILKEPVTEIQQFRLLLSRTVGRVLKSSMHLLAIELPSRM